MCVFVSVCLYVHTYASASGDQKRMWSPLEQELQAFVSPLTEVLVTELGSSRRAVSALDH